MRTVLVFLVFLILPFCAAASGYDGVRARLRVSGADAPERLYSAAQVFTGKPYKGGTLEADGPESLVLNFEFLDCVTFIENSLALSLTVASGDGGIESFKKNLMMIRYRGGAIDGYASRLHYFSDWIIDNQRKGLVQEVTKHAGGYVSRKDIYFMSAHAASNPRLADPVVLESIRKDEKRLSAHSIYLIPKEEVKKAYPHIRQGDIIVFCSSIDGLDVSHVSIAYRTGSGIGIMHASIDAKAVVRENDLYEYMKTKSRIHAIRIVRVLR